jgi:hypothetical protein
MNQNASCFYGYLYFFPAERSPHDLLATSSFATKVVAMSLRIASFLLVAWLPVLPRWFGEGASKE